MFRLFAHDEESEEAASFAAVHACVTGGLTDVAVARAPGPVTPVETAWATQLFLSCILRAPHTDCSFPLVALSIKRSH